MKASVISGNQNNGFFRFNSLASSAQPNANIDVAPFSERVVFEFDIKHVGIPGNIAFMVSDRNDTGTAQQFFSVTGNDIHSVGTSWANVNNVISKKYTEDEWTTIALVIDSSNSQTNTAQYRVFY